jgi:hypothetical protein
MSVDLSASTIDARLRQASQLAGSLQPERRLDTKRDMSATAVATHLKTASELLDLCRTGKAASAELSTRSRAAK